jgi:secondary thiamine-phosphate synthase enzyme
MYRIQVHTSGRQSFEDITDPVQRKVSESGVQEGICHVFCPHTTAALTLNENWDADVLHDIGLVLNDLVPQRRDFRHGEGNSPAHAKASLMGACQAPHPIGELERLREVLELEEALQSLDAVALHQLPVGNLLTQLGDLFITHRRLIASAGDAFQLIQC